MVTRYFTPEPINSFFTFGRHTVYCLQIFDSPLFDLSRVKSFIRFYRGSDVPSSCIVFRNKPGNDPAIPRISTPMPLLFANRRILDSLPSHRRKSLPLKSLKRQLSPGPSKTTRWVRASSAVIFPISGDTTTEGCRNIATDDDIK